MGWEGRSGLPIGEAGAESDIWQWVQGRHGMSFVLDPDLKVNVDYELDVQAKNKAVMRLRTGKKWRGDGTVASSSPSPSRSRSRSTRRSGHVQYHESQSKLIVISGTGFTNQRRGHEASLATHSAWLVQDPPRDPRPDPTRTWLPSYSTCL